MKKNKFLLLLSMVFILVLTSSSFVFAAEQKETNQQAPIVLVDLGVYGTGTLQQDENGDYRGQILPPVSAGYTAVQCVLSGNTGGISNLYQIYIRWSGSTQVANIKASSLTVSSTSVLSPATYYSNSFLISAGSTTSGYRSIGTCSIPTSVKKVRIKTSGLQCFFNNEYTWLSTGELNGTVNVN